MAQGTKCLHVIHDYMRKVELKYQHVMSIITGYNSHFEVHVIIYDIIVYIHKYPACSNLLGNL